MTEKALRYLTGFGNEHTSEALKGALPAGQTAQFEWAAHVRLGLQAGLSQEQIDAIAERRTPEFDDPDDRFIYEFAHGYYQNHRLSDDIYEQMRARWGDKGVVDLAGLIGYYSFVSVTLNVFKVPTPTGTKLLSETPER